MSVRAVVGLQWGDEGKGKLVDVLSEGASVVVRYQGGANAGHTLQIGDTTFVGHLVPSGVFRPEVLNVIGNGVVVDPAVLLDEVGALAKLGVDLANRLVLSERAHLVMPYHKLREGLDGEQGRIGTTGRGIGPAYVDKVGRIGLRVCDLYEPTLLRQGIERGVRGVGQLEGATGSVPDVQDMFDRYLDFGRRLAPFVHDTTMLLHARLAAGETVLLEGAQGTMLDVDFGTYPYLTSSNSSVCGASSGSGIPPGRIDHVIGIAKAYSTRVGEGPFPTELHDRTGTALREVGREYGATTGRPRRCGWIDLVALRYAVALNGTNEIALTKLDVLSGMGDVGVATHYEIDGRRIDTFPASAAALARARPVLEHLSGWREPLAGVRHERDLPTATRRYIEHLERALATRIRWVSVGPERDAILERDA